MAACINLEDIESWEEIELPEVYDITVDESHCYYLDCGSPILVHNSGKTYGEIQCAIYMATRTKLAISIVSHSLPHIKRGAFRDFKEIMEKWRIWKEEEFSYTDFVYTFANGSYIELFGLEDETRARGPGRDILIVNEGNLIKKSLFDQLAIRTRGQIMIDLNPSDFDCWCYSVADDSTNKKIHSTYLDNLENLSPLQVRLIEAYRDADPAMWEVFGLGIRGKSTETIYTHWKIVDRLPMKGELFCGQDFGFAVPAATVRCELYEGAVYVEELLYEDKLTNPDLIGRYQGIDMSKTIEIFCDCAEPKTIEEIRRYGYNVKEADKDVWAGIQKVKSMPLYITENSVNLLKEIKNYKWKVDKNGVVLPEEVPVKVNDHAVDAMRYAIFTKLSTPSFGWGAL